MPYFDELHSIKSCASALLSLDLPAALYLGKLKADYDYSMVTGGTPSYVEIRNCRARPSTLRSHTRRLFPDISYNDTYNVDDFINIASTLTDYCCRLYSRQPLERYYSINTEINSTGQKLINIALFNNKFEVFDAKVKTIKKQVCRLCFLTYDHADRHVCKKKCRKCRRVDCKEPSNISRTCPDCHFYFTRQECFDAHKRPAIGYRQSICEQVHFCKDCFTTFNVAKVGQFGGHKCGEDTFCGVCQKPVNIKKHNCCWKSPEVTAIQKKLKKQEEWRICFYDFETVITADLDDELPNGDQWVNVACFSIVCHQCYLEDSNYICSGCGPIRRGTIKYNNTEDRGVTDRFVDFLLTHKPLDNAYVIAHNGAKFDVHFILRVLLRKEVHVSEVGDGEKLIQITVESSPVRKCNKLYFKDSCLFIQMSLAKVPEAFGFQDQKKGDFPYLLNHPSMYGKHLSTLPEFRFYMAENRSPEAYEKLKTWYEENKQKSFDFDFEIEDYCRNDVNILRQGVSRYIKACLDMTGFNPVVHCCTFASFSFFLIKHQHMTNFKVGYLPDQGFHKDIKQSKLAITYIKWLELTEGTEYQYYLRGGEYKIPRTSWHVDAFDHATNHIVEVLGCFYHGCTKHTREDDVFFGRRMGDVHRGTLDRLNKLSDMGYSLSHVWECHIQAQCEQDRIMKDFFRNQHHFRNLQIRDAFFGARTQNFRLKAEPTVDTSIEHLDVVSMYPAVLSTTPMPQGQPDVITSDIAPITMPLPYRGFYLIDILPPRNLLHPVVPFRYEKKILFPLCRKCAMRKTRICRHNDRERMLHVTIFQAELEKALEKGYKVLKCHEVWHWANDRWSSSLFKNFLMQWFKIKMEASGWPRDNMSQEEKEEHVRQTKESEGIELDPTKIIKNLPLRTIAKLAINSSWGKFGEKSNKVQTKYMEWDSDELTTITYDPTKEVTKIMEIEELIMVRYKDVEDFSIPKPCTNVAIAAITTSMGRLMLYEALDRLQERALYCDTDSVIMINRPHADNLEDLRGDSLGRWTSEVPHGWHISSYVGGGPKVYAYEKTKNDTNEKSYHIRIRGFTRNQTNKNILNFEGIEQMVNQMAVNNGQASGVSVMEHRIVKKRGIVSSRSNPKRLRTVMDKLVLRDGFYTVPFGYL